MMCLKHLLLYMVILPMPATSPVFLALLTASILYSVRPRGYCLSLFAILFLTTSPSSPFINPDSTLIMKSNASLPLIAPVPGRTWLSHNRGRLFDPPLVGYQPFEVPKLTPIDEEDPRGTTVDLESSLPPNSTTLWRKCVDRTTEAVAMLLMRLRISPKVPEIPPPEASSPEQPDPKEDEADIPESDDPLPEGYHDFTWGGLGFVLDLGWKRTEQGLEWERRRWRRSAAKRSKQAEAKSEESAAAQLAGSKKKVTFRGSQSGPTTGATAAAQHRMGVGGGEWARASFMGLW